MADDFGIEEPQSDKARIVELVNMNLQQATNFGELAKRFDALKVELEEAKAHEIEAWDAKSAQDDENWKFIENLKSERDAALDQVVALRKVLEEEEARLASNPYPPRLGPQAFLRHRMLQDLLSNSSATAQRVKDEIERDVREAVWDKVKDMWGASPMQFRAAILGEKEE